MDEVVSSGSGRSGKATSSILVLADGRSRATATDLVAALRQGVPPHTRVFGGTAGDGWTFEGARCSSAVRR